MGATGEHEGCVCVRERGLCRGGQLGQRAWVWRPRSGLVQWVEGPSFHSTFCVYQAGLSPYERMLIFSTRYGIRFSSSRSHTFWQ